MTAVKKPILMDWLFLISVVKNAKHGEINNDAFMRRVPNETKKFNAGNCRIRSSVFTSKWKIPKNDNEPVPRDGKEIPEVNNTKTSLSNEGMFSICDITFLIQFFPVLLL